MTRQVDDHNTRGDVSPPLLRNDGCCPKAGALAGDAYRQVKTVRTTENKSRFSFRYLPI